jgi:hypothetical protein
MKKGMIFLCSILCLFVSVGISNATEFIVNGGFESGLTGWEHSANVSFLEQDELGQISAYEGNYMAVLGTLAGSLNASLSQDFNPNALSGQQFELSFAYNLQALDWTHYLDGGGDMFAVTIAASIGDTQLFSETINDPFGDGTTVSGWRTVSRTLPDLANITGDITLEFFLNNQDFTQCAAAYVDAVSVHDVADGSDPDASVPDASIMFLLGPGLVGLGLFGRRKFFKK